MKNSAFFAVIAIITSACGSIDQPGTELKQSTTEQAEVETPVWGQTEKVTLRAYEHKEGPNANDSSSTFHVYRATLNENRSYEVRYSGGETSIIGGIANAYKYPEVIVLTSAKGKDIFREGKLYGIKIGSLTFVLQPNKKFKLYSHSTTSFPLGHMGDYEMSFKN